MASRSLGSLTIDLIARTFGFEQGLDRAARTADKRMKEIEARAKKFGAIVGASLVAGAGLVADQLRRTIDHMDELSKAAQRANMPTEDFTKLAYAADLADVSIQDLQSSMGRLAKAQGDAEKSTSTQARVFEALGIATRDAEGNLRATQEVFLDFADAFQRHRGSPEIMAAGMQIFGRSFQNLIPLLKDGSQGLREAGEEAEALAIAFGDEAGAQAEKFNDDLVRLQTAFRGVWIQVAQQLLPQLINLTGQFVEAAKDGDTLKNVADNIADALVRVANTASQFAAVLGKIGELRDMLVSVENVAKRFSLGGITGIGDKVRSVLPDWMYAPIGGSGPASPSAPRAAPGRETDYSLGAPLNEAELAAQSRRLRGALGDAPKKSTGKSDAEKQAERIAKAIRQMTDAQREWQTELDGTGNPILDQYARRLDDIKEKAERFNELKVPQEQISKFTQEMEKLALSIKDKELADFSREFDWSSRELQNGLSGVSSAAVDYERALFDLNEQLKQTLISQSQYDERLASIESGRFEGASSTLRDLEFELRLMKMGNAERAAAIQLRGMEAEAVAKYGDAIVQANRDIEESMKQIELMDGMRDAFSGFIQDVVSGTSTIKDAFKDMLDSINRMIAQRIADNWTEQLFGQMGTTQSGSSGGGWMAMIASFFGGGKANGGGVSGGMIYPVTEYGDEMLTVRGRNYLLSANSGTVTPNKQMSRGGGVNVTQQFINPVMADRRGDTQRAADAARKLREAQRYA